MAMGDGKIGAEERAALVAWYAALLEDHPEGTALIIMIPTVLEAAAWHDLVNERWLQERLREPCDHDPLTWLALIAKFAGDANKGLLDAMYEATGSRTPDRHATYRLHALSPEAREGLGRYRRALVSVAALCLAAVASHDAVVVERESYLDQRALPADPAPTP